MKLILLLSQFVILFHFSGKCQSNVLYGERELDKKNISFFFDKDGYLYPDYLITNKSLADSQSSLEMWYRNHPSDFAAIAEKYLCKFNTFSLENSKILDDSIRNNILMRINASKKLYGNTTLLIHGFRKPFNGINGDGSSVDDFNILETTIAKFRKNKSLYVEIYWDALYGCCFSSSSSRNRVLFQLFSDAQKNSLRVGHKLRQVLSGLQYDTLNIVTHSLGAKVASSALFDIVATSDDMPTPINKRVNICLIAPALAGQDIIRNYYKRHTAYDYKKQDNYRLSIVYNENDFVLLKKDNRLGFFGPGPYNYGVTTLGCNFDNDAINLKNYFNKNFTGSDINLFNLSIIGKCHLMSCYCYKDNLKSLSKFMDK